MEESGEVYRFRIHALGYLRILFALRAVFGWVRLLISFRLYAPYKDKTPYPETGTWGA
jgi:hypothetical protein